jgi:putative selenium metabolism protein SsnA
MSIILDNAILVDLDPPGVESESLRVDEGCIVARGSVVPGPADSVIDCGGAVVLPGLVNGHTHLYSALAAGMPGPRVAPADFREILDHVWWRLDRALDAESIEVSAQIGAIDAIRCGTTTLIDHHASPNCIAGSLDLIEQGARGVGVRLVQCYETTDRHGPQGARDGIAENRRYLDQCTRRHDGFCGALVGAHAAFTLERDTLEQLAALARSYNTGVHIHVAEGECDDDDARQRFGMPVVDLLEDADVLRAESILAHGTHLGGDAGPLLRKRTPTIAHCARSNMNNAVGYAPVAEFPCPRILGTDGIGSDMLTEARFAWFKARDAGSQLTPQDVLGMLAGSARRASESLGVTLGRLTPGAAADLVVTDYVPATPLHAENLFGHLVFAMGAQFVKDVMIAGNWVMRERCLVACNEADVRRHARQQAAELWHRIDALPD